MLKGFLKGHGTSIFHRVAAQTICKCSSEHCQFYICLISDIEGEGLRKIVRGSLIALGGENVC